MGLRARWALRSTVPGKSGYEITAVSPGVDKGIAGQLIGQFTLGTPPSFASSSDPAALPWIWFVPANLYGASLGVAIMNPGRSSDQDGRVPSPTRIFWLEAESILAHRPDYTTLARVLGAVNLPTESGDTYEIDASFAETDSIDSPKALDLLVDTAALLLKHPVRIVAKARESVRNRVQDLDAIASMLPYGYRLDLSASTWIQPDADRGDIRIGFSLSGEDSRWHRVVWDDGDPPELHLSGISADYAARLRRIIMLMGIESVRTHLADDRIARRFDDPSGALDWLAQLDEPFDTWFEIVEGRGDVELARKIVREKSTPKDGEDDFGIFLLLEGTPDDLPLIQDLMSSKESSIRFGIALAVAAVRWIDNGSVDVLLDYAAEIGHLDRLLLALIQGAAAMDGLRRDLGHCAQPNTILDQTLRPRRSNPLATDTRRTPEGTFGASSPDGIAYVNDWLAERPNQQFPIVGQILSDQPSLAYQFVDCLLQQSPQEDPIVRLRQFGIHSQIHDERLRPLFDVLTGSLELGRDDLELVSRLRPSMVTTLVQLSVRNGDGSIVPALWDWIPTAVAILTPSDRARLSSLLRTQSQESASRSLPLMVKAELLCILLDQSVATWRVPIEAEVPRQAALAELEHFIVEPPFAAAFKPIMEAFLRANSQGLTWASDEQTLDLLDLIGAFGNQSSDRSRGRLGNTSEGFKPTYLVLCEVVANAILRHPAIMDFPSATRWEPHLREAGYAPNMAVAALRYKFDKTRDADKRAKLVVDVVLAETTLERATSQIGSSLSKVGQTLSHPNELLVLAGCIAAQLADNGIDRAKRQLVVETVCRATLSSRDGTVSAEDFDKWILKSLPELYWILTTIMTRYESEMDEGARAALRDMTSWAETVFDKQRSRQFFGSRRKGGR